MSAIRAMMRPSMLRAQAPRVGQVQHRFIAMKPTTRMMRPVPKEEHSAHTISQRLRSLKKIPPELIPLGVVLGYAPLRSPSPVGPSSNRLTTQLRHHHRHLLLHSQILH
ncbi:uncharacterized protein PV09_02780 [Verruconis gallopava]|uniref:Uncharacterized protein n=1 Tax=Verruconis gallopava TaxID=253628 RepID=A0A0D2AIB4_9PEZI|nr:uncharacterized protein PV09_02780 [Verruconis gallopava]KIW06315.1 hypothetical protein PV09_02780 [Verruconis gallopava]